MEVEGVGAEWPTMKGRTDKAAVQEERWALVEPLYQAGKYDHEIGAEFGVSDATILKLRKYMGKPANKRDDRYLWHDQAAQQRHAAQMVKHRKNVRRGAKPSFL